jgi:3-hydroxyisobutyrate dehydrogenase
VKGGPYVLGFLNSSVLCSAFTEYKAHALTELDFTITFTASLLREDLDLGLATARDLEVPTPLAATVQQIVQAAIGAGHAGLRCAERLERPRCAR